MLILLTAGCGPDDPPPLPDPPAHVLVPPPPPPPPAPVVVSAVLTWAGQDGAALGDRPARLEVGPDHPDAVLTVRKGDVWNVRAEFIEPDGGDYPDRTRSFVSLVLPEAESGDDAALYRLMATFYY